MENANQEPNLQIRFRRGDQWISGRLCSAGVNGVFVASTTPARIGEIIELELSLQDEGAWRAAGLSHPEIVLSAVIVSSRVSDRRGPPGFAAQLRFKQHSQRRDLVTMLQAARGRATLRPPPSRSEARYPVSWPILVGVDNKRCRMSALDISRSGMFVGGAAPLPHRGQCLDVTFALDGDGAPIRGVTRVARTIPRDMAQRRKLRRGMGLQFCEMGARNRRELNAFVQRIAFRSTRNIVVTAAGTRLHHLAMELNAVGYAVTGISESKRLFAVCNDEHNAPDLVIFDNSFTDDYPDATQIARRVLTTRRIANTDYDEPFAKPVRGLADSILAPAESVWLDIGWAS